MPSQEVIKLIENELIKDPSTSDKSIAKAFRTTNKTVNNIRRRLIHDKIIEDPFLRRGMDGKSYRVRQSNETKKIIIPKGSKYAITEIEKRVEILLERYLKSHGLEVRRQYKCDVGIIDLLTRECLYEVKRKITRERLFEAIGQALLYRQALRKHNSWTNFTGKVAIISGSYEKGVVNLLDYTQNLGVDVLIWADDKPMLLSEYDKSIIP